MGRSGTITLALCLLFGCGAPAATARTARASAVDPAAFLLEVGAESTVVLRRPGRSIDELDAARREARGAERREVTRDLVVAHVFAADEAEGREARRLRRRAEQLADACVRGSRDSTLLAEIAFARLWMSWRAGASNAEQRAARFTERFRAAGELTTLAWMIRGEIALAGERWVEAITAFRFALGRLDSPLYAYALWRTAAGYRGLGREEDAAQALSEVEQLGCAASASAFVVRVATSAASQRGSGLRQDPDGLTRPAACPSTSERERGEDEGWRPEE